MADDKVDHIMMELRRIAHETERAKTTAETAMAEIATHERECAIRYAGIVEGLKPIPDLYSKISNMSRALYMGMGVMLTVPVIFGLILTIKQVVGK